MNVEDFRKAGEDWPGVEIYKTGEWTLEVGSASVCLHADARRTVGAIMRYAGGRA